MAETPPLYDLFDGTVWHAALHLTGEQAAKFNRRGYRVVLAAPGQEQPRVAMTTASVQKSLDDPINVPHECICAFIRVLPYGLVQRQSNPDCTEHSPDELGGELERDRD